MLYFFHKVSCCDAICRPKSVIKPSAKYSYADLKILEVKIRKVDTWRVGGRVQGDRRYHARITASDRVLMGMLMMWMMAGERLRLLVRRIIGVERFVACHQRVQHLEHHFRRRDGVNVAAAAAAASAVATAAGR